MYKRTGYVSIDSGITMAAFLVAYGFGLAALAVLVGTLASHLGGGLGGGAMALAIVGAFTVLVAYVIASRPKAPPPDADPVATARRLAEDMAEAS